jgi:sporulation protein YlmC with PRC-barrel domain
MLTKRTLMGTAAMVLGLAAPAAAQETEPAATVAPLQDAEIVSLPAWQADAAYYRGWSAEEFIDDVEVYGPTGENIGEVENIVVGPDGRILSIVAEVGGLWDIGDTHVNVPWSEVEIGPGMERVTIPVTQETVERYAERTELAYLPGEVAEDRVVPVEEDDLADDLVTGPRAWRVDQLINDYVRLADGVPYGWVGDVIFDAEGQVQAVIVSQRGGYGAGAYPYPWFGYRYAWTPTTPYYSLPYAEPDIAELEPFDYERLEVETVGDIE